MILQYSFYAIFVLLPLSPLFCFLLFELPTGCGSIADFKEWVVGVGWG